MVMRDISVKPHQTMIYSHRSPDEKDNLADRSPPPPHSHIKPVQRERRQRHLILSVPLSLVRMMTSGWPLQPSYSDRPGDQDGGVAPARNQGNPGCLDISQGQPLPEKAQ